MSSAGAVTASGAAVTCGGVFGPVDVRNCAPGRDRRDCLPSAMSDSDVVAAPPPTEQQPAGAAERQPDADNRDSSTPVQTGAVAEDDHGMPTEQEAEATSADAVAAQAVSSADVAVGDGHISAAEKRPREASPPATIPVSKKPVHERESVAATQTSPERPSTEPKLVLDRGSNLIINFVPRSLNDSLLRDLFSPFGEIESARTIVDRNTGQCQGYGFVKFFTNESAAKAVLHFQKAAADERELKVHFARPATTHKQCNLYVTGLPIHFTDDDAANVFKDYGPVVETKILIGTDSHCSRSSETYPDLLVGGSRRQRRC